MSTIRLFGSRISPFVEKVARALALKQLDFELVPPASPLDFRAWSPQTGKMPVLEIDGEKVYDSTFILRRLDADFPEPPLFARDSQRAAAQRQLEDWSDESLYWLLMAARWSKRSARATTEQLVETLPRLLRPVARRVLPRKIGGSVRAQGLGLLPWEVLIAEWGQHLDDLTVILGEHPFFYDDSISAADLALYGQFSTARSGPTPEFAELISHRPGLLQFEERVEQITGGSRG